MTNNISEEDGTVPSEEISEYDRLVKMKALGSKRLALQRAASRAIYEALSLEEKALVDEEFGKLAMKIASQFGRSRPFVYAGPHTQMSSRNKDD